MPTVVRILQIKYYLNKAMSESWGVEMGYSFSLPSLLPRPCHARVIILTGVLLYSLHFTGKYLFAQEIKYFFYNLKLLFTCFIVKQ